MLFSVRISAKQHKRQQNNRERKKKHIGTYCLRVLSCLIIIAVVAHCALFHGYWCHVMGSGCKVWWSVCLLVAQQLVDVDAYVCCSLLTRKDKRKKQQRNLPHIFPREFMWETELIVCPRTPHRHLFQRVRERLSGFKSRCCEIALDIYIYIF